MNEKVSNVTLSHLCMLHYTLYMSQYYSVMYMYMYNYTDKHSEMLNMTARLAIEIKNLPDWEVDWNDTTPQRDPTKLTISNLLPSEADGAELEKRAVQHIMHTLVEEFSCLADLQSLLPPNHSQNASRSNVVPMKVLFKDEKFKSETIDILSRLVTDAELSGKPEVT